MTLQLWHDFFLLTGTAAATLLGLVFVAASIAATIPNEKLGDDSSRKIWVLPIVWAFVRVLVVSALGVIPGQTWTSFGYVLLALGVFDLSATVWNMRALTRFHRSKERLSVIDWFWYLLYPMAATLSIVATGLSLSMGWALPVQVLAVGMIGHLVIGVHNAWELADWLATRQ